MDNVLEGKFLMNFVLSTHISIAGEKMKRWHHTILGAIIFYEEGRIVYSCYLVPHLTVLIKKNDKGLTAKIQN